MEVASPLALPPPSSAGGNHNKRSLQLACSSSSSATSPLTEMELDQHHEHNRLAKRRRFHNNTNINETSIESLSKDFSSQSLFYTNSGIPTSVAAAAANKGLFAAAAAAAGGNTNGSTLKRSRSTANSNESPLPASLTTTTSTATTSSSPAREELRRVVQEQATLIESLKTDKSNLEDSLTNMNKDHERVVKENQILRKAVNIQQERQTNAEKEVKKIQSQADEKIKGLEQMILSLRYHLSAQHNNTNRNDFMHQPPPDVY